MSIPISPETGLATTTIDEHTYEFSIWGAQSALETLFDISTVLGKPLVQLLAMVHDNPDAELKDVVGPQASLAGVDAIVEHLIGQMTTGRERTLGLIRKLAAEGGVLCDKKKVSFDAHYQNRLAHLFRVVRVAVEVQYGDFFAAVAPLAGLRPVGPGQASASPTA